MKNFRKSKIGLAIMAITLANGYVYAQTNGDEIATELEEVVVTGIRASLTRSLDVKRNSDKVVDSISAEDVGQFPDNNIADSLQRITGVAIDRSGGEGQFITVRGLGPEFNTVLVNGRTMATENAGREFSFDVLASDIISRAEVYKTATPDIQEGGIGAVVNVVTGRPLNTDGTNFSYSLGAINDTLASETSPEASLLYSTVNSDKTFGFLGSISYSEREGQRDFANGQFTAGSQQTVNAPVTAVGLGPEALGSSASNVVRQRTLNFSRETSSRDRLTANATLQAKVGETGELTIDGLFSKFDISSREIRAAYFLAGPFIDLQTNGNGTTTSFSLPGRTDFIANNPDLGLSGGQLDTVITSSNRETESSLLGVNYTWESGDFSYAADLSTSSAESERLNPFVVIGSLATTSPLYELTSGGGGDVPTISNLGSSQADPNAQRAHFINFQRDNVEDDILEGRFDVDWNIDNGSLSEIEFGFSYSNREKTGRFAQANDNSRCAFCGYNVLTDTSILNPESFGSFLPDASGRISIPDAFFSVDPIAQMQFLSRPDVLRDPAQTPGLTPAEREARAQLIEQGGIPGNIYSPEDVPSRSRNVEEDVQAVYLNSVWESDRWSANFGVRIAKTETTSIGFGQEVTSIAVPPGDNQLRITLGDPMPIRRTSSYTNVLPSFNLKYDLSENQLLRFALSQTVTRPTVTSLGTDNSFSGRVGSAQSGGGNPDLEPFESTNLDISYEHYFSDLSFLGVAVFHKEFDQFLESQTLPLELLGFTFEDTRTRNGEEGSISGLEIAGQHTFDNGLGFAANYTYVDSGVERAAGSAAADCDFNGLSENSVNVSGFYETEKISARLSYNWRDEFLVGCFSSRGLPQNREAFGQVDFSASYNLTDTLQLYLSGINILDEDTRDFTVFEERFLNYEDTGSRYTLGLRGKF